jgi:hypothetical protein
MSLVFLLSVLRRLVIYFPLSRLQHLLSSPLKVRHQVLTWTLLEFQQYYLEMVLVRLIISMPAATEMVLVNLRTPTPGVMEMVLVHLRTPTPGVMEMVLVRPMGQKLRLLVLFSILPPSQHCHPQVAQSLGQKLRLVALFSILPPSQHCRRQRLSARQLPVQQLSRPADQ